MATTRFTVTTKSPKTDRLRLFLVDTDPTRRSKCWWTATDEQDVLFMDRSEAEGRAAALRFNDPQIIGRDRALEIMARQREGNSQWN